MKIELKKWTWADKDSLTALFNSVDRTYLSSRVPSPYTDADAEWWLEMVAANEGVGGTFRAIAVNGKVVGSISVERKDDVYRLDGKLGYVLLTGYWNQGIMTEAVRQVCAEAFSELQLNRITAYVFQPNAASQCVLLKNGFVLEGVMRQAVVKDDKTYDVCIYGLLKQEQSL